MAYSRPSPTAASRRNEPARLGGLRRRVGRCRESRVGLSSSHRAGRHFSFGDEGASLISSRSRGADGGRSVKILSFVRDAVCGRSLIGISPLSTNLFGGEVNKSIGIAYIGVPAHEIFMYAGRSRMHHRMPIVKQKQPNLATRAWWPAAKHPEHGNTHYKHDNTTKSDPMTIALMH